MRHLRKKQRDRILKRIAIAAAIAAALIVGLLLYEGQPSQSKSPQTMRSQSLGPPEQEAGYSVYYSDKLRIGFLFPQEQDPLKANIDIRGVLDSVRTRDFTISIYRAAEFQYQPWQDSLGRCTYDGALHQFVSQSDNQDCSFGQQTFSAVSVFYNDFALAGKTKHVYLAPAQNRQYFIEFAVVYDEDCAAPTSPLIVCRARSEQKRNKLEQFVRSVAVKNHELFRPWLFDSLIE